MFLIYMSISVYLFSVEPLLMLLMYDQSLIKPLIYDVGIYVCQCISLFY